MKTLWPEWVPEVHNLRYWRQLRLRVGIEGATKARIRCQYLRGELFEIDYCGGDLIQRLQRK